MLLRYFSPRIRILSLPRRDPIVGEDLQVDPFDGPCQRRLAPPSPPCAPRSSVLASFTDPMRPCRRPDRLSRRLEREESPEAMHADDTSFASGTASPQPCLSNRWSASWQTNKPIGSAATACAKQKSHATSGASSQLHRNVPCGLKGKSACIHPSRLHASLRQITLRHCAYPHPYSHAHPHP